MNNKCGPSGCPKAGIKIHETPPNKKPSVNFHKTTLLELDLDVDNYSLDDLYNLFNISNNNSNQVLDEHSLKGAKQIVLKMHPDKSQLDSKYFLFFSKASRVIL